MPPNHGIERTCFNATSASPMPFDKQPKLTGALVGVRPLLQSDYDPLYAVAADPLIWEQHPVPNRHEESVFRDFFAESLESGGALLVTDRQTGGVIGSSRFHGYSQAKSEVEIGWTFLARSDWGGRYNGDLKAIMARHAFQFVESIVLFINPSNSRSLRAATKVGAVPEAGLDRDGRMIFRLHQNDALILLASGSDRDR
jgi:RimJ/RimL family protein N-acetyltransferase